MATPFRQFAYHALPIFGLFCLSPDGASAASRNSPPNIVLVVLDDVGFADIGSFGSEIRTPNIDALAADGLRFNRFDTKAVCSPTRASLLTGRNPQTVRMADLPAARLDPNDLSRDRGELPQNAQTIAQVLRAKGYQTFGYGKWHLAPESEDGTTGKNASWPLQRGFDAFHGFFLGWTDQYNPKLISGNRRIPAPQTSGYHFSVDITDRAIASLAAGGRPKFVYLSYGAGHSPIQVPKSWIDAYAGVYEKGWDAIREERFARQKAMGVIPASTQLTSRSPAEQSWDSLSAVERTVYARYMATYAGFLTHTDDQIGKLVSHLKSTGQYENTLIVLVSDNGGASEAGQKGYFERLYVPNKLTAEQMLERIDDLGSPRTNAEYPKPWAWAGSTPFSRYKLWPQLGGVRTPMIVSWPKVVKGQGSIRSNYVDAVDIAPTLAEAAGTQFPKSLAGIKEIPLAGQSILSTFSNPKAKTRSVQYFELRGNRAITSGNWRAVAVHKRDTSFESDQWKLFNTAMDFSESTDLADRYPEKLKEMKALWWKEARKFSSPALAEAPQAFRYREMFDDTPDRPDTRISGETK